MGLLVTMVDYTGEISDCEIKLEKQQKDTKYLSVFLKAVTCLRALVDEIPRVF